MAASRRKSEQCHHDQPSKRRRQSPAVIHDEEGDSGDSGLSDDNGLHTKSKNLACHFYKRFPTQFTRCMFRNQLTSTSFAVQHLRRAHMQHIQCPNCNRSFDSVPELDWHIQQQKTCRDAGPVREDLDKGYQGLDSRQLAKLSCRSRRGLTEEQRWFEIWDVLFPAVDRPGSPYIDSPEDEILRIARQGLERVCPPGASSQVLDRLNWSTVSSALENPSPDQPADQVPSEADSPSSCWPLMPPTPISTELKSAKRFACPFVRHDPGRYKSKACCGPGWASVHRVKEHVYRHHSPKGFFCLRCLEHFDGLEAFENHLRANTPCKFRAPVSDDIITEEKGKLLRVRAKAHCPEETKWEEMYRIIFPNEKKIPSPYAEFGNPRLQGADEYKNFLHAELQRRVRPAIEEYVASLFEEVQKKVNSNTVEMLRDLDTKVLKTIHFQEEQSSFSALAAMSPDQEVAIAVAEPSPLQSPGPETPKLWASLEGTKDDGFANYAFADWDAFFETSHQGISCLVGYENFSADSSCYQ